MLQTSNKNQFECQGELSWTHLSPKERAHAMLIESDSGALEVVGQQIANRVKIACHGLMGESIDSGKVDDSNLGDLPKLLSRRCRAIAKCLNATTFSMYCAAFARKKDLQSFFHEQPKLGFRIEGAGKAAIEKVINGNFKLSQAWEKFISVNDEIFSLIGSRLQSGEVDVGMLHASRREVYKKTWATNEECYRFLVSELKILGRSQIPVEVNLILVPKESTSEADKKAAIANFKEWTELMNRYEQHKAEVLGYVSDAALHLFVDSIYE